MLIKRPADPISPGRTFFFHGLSIRGTTRGRILFSFFSFTKRERERENSQKSDSKIKSGSRTERVMVIVGVSLFNRWFSVYVGIYKLAITVIFDIKVYERLIWSLYSQRALW